VSTNEVMDTTGTGRRRNRSWPEALKREIVAASFVPGASVSVIARRYDVNANQVFRWRKLFRNGFDAAADPTTPQLVPVIVTTEEHGEVVPAPSAMDTIEIEIAGKYRIRVGSGVDGKALRRVLDVLERRPVCRSPGEGR
jgi:transposase-like protein